MSESISNQVSRILMRVDQKLMGPGSSLKSFESLRVDADKGEAGKTVDSIQEIIKNSIGKYLKSDNLRCDSLKSGNLKGDYSQNDYLKRDCLKSDRSKTPEVKEEAKARPLTPNTSRPPEAKFQPKLNKNSLMIASRLKDPKERLANSSAPKILPRDEEFTYQPQINKYSQRIVSKKPEGKARWDTLYEQGKDKKKEMERIRIETESREKEMLNCSFKPNILQPSLNINPNKTVERLNSWAKNRDTKIKDKKENETEKGLKECTFMPKISENQVSCKNLYEIKGVAPYVERGKKIQNLGTEKVVVQTVNRDIGKKLYTELVEALHEALF